MRKAIVGAVVAGLVLGAASAASAQDWSIGVGGAFSTNFGGGYKGDLSSYVRDSVFVTVLPTVVITNTTNRYDNGDRIPLEPETIIRGSVVDSVTTIERGIPSFKEMFTPHSSSGLDVFFSSKYAEATVGMAYMGGTWKKTVIGPGTDKPVYTYAIERTVADTIIRYETVDFVTVTDTVTGDRIPQKVGGTVDSTVKHSFRNDTIGVKPPADLDSTWEKDIQALNVNIGIWLKYPYNLSDAVQLFPMAGVEYEICTVISKDLHVVTANKWSRTWFKAGLGSDIGVSERLYIHPVVLYGIGWKNSVERGIAKEAGPMGSTKISHGLTARIGLGYRFDAD